MNVRKLRSEVLLFMVALSGCDNTIKGHFSRGQVVDLAAPTNLQGAADPNGASIHLTWTDNATGESGYRVEGNDAPFGAFIPIILQNIPADSAAFDMPTQSNTTYYVRVFATFWAQDSPSSNVITVTTPDVPAAPLGLSATTVSSSQIDLGWTNPPGTIIANRLERSLD